MGLRSHPGEDPSLTCGPARAAGLGMLKAHHKPGFLHQGTSDVPLIPSCNHGPCPLYLEMLVKETLTLLDLGPDDSLWWKPPAHGPVGCGGHLWSAATGQEHPQPQLCQAKNMSPGTDDCLLGLMRLVGNVSIRHS